MATMRFKIVTVGNQGIGKTSIIQRFASNTFDPQYQTTLGIDYMSRVLQMQGESVRLQVWDTAGQERFRSLVPSYIRDSSVILLCFSVTNRESFIAAIGSWYQLILEQHSRALIYLIANKIDQKESNRRVTSREAAQWAQERGLQYQEVSALTGQNVEDLFTRIAAQFVEMQRLQTPVEGGSGTSFAVITNESDDSSCAC
jgi:Ras-related protein Rab-6A